MFIAPDNILAKFNLSRNISRMIALLLVIVGAWFGLSYYGERRMLALAKQVESQMLELQKKVVETQKETFM